MAAIDLNSLPTLYQVIAEEGTVPPRLLERAVMEQSRTGEDLAQVLLRQSLVPSKAIAKAMARQYGLDYYDIKPNEIEPSKGFPDTSLFFAYGILPLKKEPDRLVVAISDPANLPHLDRFRSMYHIPIVPVIATREATVKS